MKQIILIFLLLPLCLYAQPITFDKLYPNGRHAYAVIPNSQGYVMAGNSQSQDYWLCQTDFYGNILWEKTYGLHYGIVDAHFMGNTVRAKDGGYFLAGISFSMPDSNWQKPYGYIVKTDSMGNKEWEAALHTTYDSTMTNKIYNIMATEDGGCLVTGTIILTYQDTGSMYHEGAYMVKINALGSVEWEKKHDYGLSVHNYQSVVELPNQQGYMVGYCTPYAKKGAIFRLDTNGDTLWAKEYTPLVYNPQSYYPFNGIVKTRDGNFLTYGTFMVKVNIDGDILWQKDGQVYAKNSTNNGLYVHSQTLEKLDEANGNILWSKDFGNLPIKDFAKTEDGGFVILTTQGSSAVRLIKIDCEGNVQNPIFCTTGLHPETPKIKVNTYPNPIEDKVNIEIGETGNYEIQVLDIQGKCLQAIFIKDSDYSVMNTEKLGKGMYILSIKNLATTQTYQTKLVKE